MKNIFPTKFDHFFPLQCKLKYYTKKLGFRHKISFGQIQHFSQKNHAKKIIHVPILPLSNQSLNTKKKRYHITGKDLNKSKKQKEYIIMTHAGKMISKEKPEGGYAIERPRNKTHFFTTFLKKIRPAYICMLEIQRKQNATIEDLDKEKDKNLERVAAFRYNVLIRNIQKSFIEALNVCPNNCAEELCDIYELVISDMPSNLKQQGLGGTDNIDYLRTFVEDRNEMMADDMYHLEANFYRKKGFVFIQDSLGDGFYQNCDKQLYLAKLRGMRTQILLQCGSSKQDCGIEEDDGVVEDDDDDDAGGEEEEDYYKYGKQGGSQNGDDQGLGNNGDRSNHLLHDEISLVNKNEDALNTDMLQKQGLVEKSIPQTKMKTQEFKKPIVKKLGVKKTEVKKPEVKKTEVKKPEVKKPEVKKNEVKKTEVKKTEVKESEVKKPEVKKPEVKKPEVKKPEVKKPEVKKPEVKKPQVKKPLVSNQIQKKAPNKETKPNLTEIKTVYIQKDEAIKIDENGHKISQNDEINNFDNSHDNIDKSSQEYDQQKENKDVFEDSYKLEQSNMDKNDTVPPLNNPQRSGEEDDNFRKKQSETTEKQSHRENNSEIIGTDSMFNEKRELYIVEGFSSLNESKIEFDETQIEDKISQYFERLDPLFSQSMISKWEEISEIIEASDKEVIITFRDNSSQNIKGLAIISIIGSDSRIIHLSTYKKQDFGIACSKVTEYVKNNSVIKSVVFSIFHIPKEVEGAIKVKMDPFFGIELKKVGFRWKCLENMKNGQRATVYFYKGQDEDENKENGRSSVRLNTAKIQSSKIRFNHLLILSDCLPEFDHLQLHRGAHDTMLAELFCLNEYKVFPSGSSFNKWVKSNLLAGREVEASKIGKMPYQKIELDQLNSISRHFTSFIKKEGEELNLEANFLSSQTISLKLNCELDMTATRAATHDINGVNYSYLRINISQNTHWMTNKIHNIDIFLIPTSTQMFMQFIIKFEGKDSKKYSDSTLLRENIDSLFKNLEKKESATNYKDIWVPSFKFNSLTTEGNKILGDLEDCPYILSLLEVDVSGREESEAIKRFPTEESVVIENGFIYGLIESNLEKTTEIPFAACLITPKLFTKIEQSYQLKNINNK